MSEGISGVMDALKAESLLKDSQLFIQIEKLCADLQYNTQDKQFAFDDYFKILVSDIDAVPKLQLENDVAPGTETIYTIQLTTSTEQIVDECDRISRRLNQFEGKLKEAERKINNVKAEFVAWYMLAGGTLLSDLKVKFPMTELRKLGEAEFSRHMGGLDVAVIHLIEAIKIETTKVTQHKAVQKEKYNLGKDQANAAWTSTLPAFGNTMSWDKSDQLSAAQEPDDDIPPVINSRPVIGDQFRVLGLSDIKGTFIKKGTPQPITLVTDDSNTMNKRKLITEEDDVL
jgi:hypothetical protein